MSFFFQLDYLGLRLENLDNSCFSLGYLLFKTGTIFANFNRSEKTPVEKERLKRYTSGSAIICWLIFSIFVGMLFRPSDLFGFIRFMIELTPCLLVLKAWKVYQIFQVGFIICIFSANDTKKSLKESAKIFGLDSTLSFIFIYLMFFWVFFDIYNESYSIPCSLGIIFMFLK